MGENVELVPWDVDAPNDDVVEHGFHKDVTLVSFGLFLLELSF